jgi:hypothetical protein
MSRVNRELFNAFFLEVKQPLSLRGHCGLLSFHSHVAEAHDKEPGDNSPDRVSALPDCCGYKCGDDDFEYEGDHGVTALKTNIPVSQTQFGVTRPLGFGIFKTGPRFYQNSEVAARGRLQ